MPVNKKPKPGSHTPKAYKKGATWEKATNRKTTNRRAWQKLPGKKRKASTVYEDWSYTTPKKPKRPRKK